VAAQDASTAEAAAAAPVATASAGGAALEGAALKAVAMGPPTLGVMPQQASGPRASIAELMSDQLSRTSTTLSWLQARYGTRRPERSQEAEALLWAPRREAWSPHLGREADAPARLPISRVGQAHIAPRKRSSPEIRAVADPLADTLSTSLARLGPRRKSSPQIQVDADALADTWLTGLARAAPRGESPPQVQLGTDILADTLLTGQARAAPRRRSSPEGQEPPPRPAPFSAPLPSREPFGPVSPVGTYIPKDCLVPSRPSRSLASPRERGGDATPVQSEVGSIVAQLSSVRDRLTLLFPEGPGGGRTDGEVAPKAELGADDVLEWFREKITTDTGGGLGQRDACSLEFSFSHRPPVDPAPAGDEVQATPRATLLVAPGTSDKVGTVCRKPRPKACCRVDGRRTLRERNSALEP